MAWAPDYCTSTELKAWVRVSDTVDDAQLSLAITAASRAVDDHCGRQFGSAAGTRYYRAEYRESRGLWVVPIDDLMNLSGLAVTVDGTDIGSSYVLEPRNAAAEGRPYTRLVVDSAAAAFPEGVEDDVAVAATWGWSAVPSAVKLATMLQAHRFVSRRDSPFGIIGSPATGGEIRLLAKLDPDLRTSLAAFCRIGRVR